MQRYSSCLPVLPKDDAFPRGRGLLGGAEPLLEQVAGGAAAGVRGAARHGGAGRRCGQGAESPEPHVGPLRRQERGHDPNPGHASVDGGVLVALRHMKGAQYDAEKGVAYVKPEESELTVPTQSIVAWETVMANGTIVNITQETHPDLAVAMRGGGNQFGIVTQFTVKTRPMGKVWGGVRVYRRSRWEQLQAALHDFITTGAEDPKAAIIFADFFMFKNWGVYSVFFFYDGENPPSTGPFAEMLKIPATVGSTSTKKYSSLLWMNGFLADWIRGRVLFRVSTLTPSLPLFFHHHTEDPDPPADQDMTALDIQTFTLPAIPSNPRVYDEIATQWHSIMLGGYLNQLRQFPSQCSVEFQPLPAVVGRQSERAGGNAMGLRAADPDRIVLNLQCMWRRARDDAAVWALAAEMTAWLAGRLPAWNRQAGLVGPAGGDEEGARAREKTKLLLLLLLPTCRCS
ncbi:hypothetical protein PG984_008825 [Apiospora sp. TS-2023a]